MIGLGMCIICSTCSDVCTYTKQEGDLQTVTPLSAFQLNPVKVGLDFFHQGGKLSSDQDPPRSST